MKKALIVVAVLALASTAAQAVVIDGKLEVNITEVGTYTYALGGTVTAYQVNLKVLDPLEPELIGGEPNPKYGKDLIWAFDVDITGDLYQLCKDYSSVYGPILYTPTLADLAGYTAAEVAIDTHLLVSDLLIETAPAEDNDRVYGLSSPTFTAEGLGTTLSGAAALGSGALQDLPFAYVVIPAGGSALLTGSVADGLGTEYAFGGGGINIPEPAPLAMLVIGGLGLIARKRRS